MIRQLEPPEHLDSIDNADVSVGKVVEATKGEGREHPDQGDTNVGDCGAAAEKDGPDVVDDYGLDPPVRVEDGEGAEDGVGDGGRVQERKDHRRHLCS